MTAPRRRRNIFANPFFAILMATSVLFVLTVLGYLVSPSVLVPKPGSPPGGPASIAAAQWLDESAPKALACEILVMLATGVLAMATDRWFADTSKRKPSS
jgi:hypothetical protein